METLEAKLSPKTTIPEEDDRPQAYEKSKRGGWITFPFITGSVMAGSFHSSRWVGVESDSFVITEFNVKSITAIKISNVVLGCSSLFPLASAIIADSFFGSFPVVSFFAFVSLLVINLAFIFQTFYIFGVMNYW
ncbi:hypothetical protein I3843_02G154700 [Carya illinoinensis]|nr:hypothetical protein I3843_02G154700 [Carya illinoinensis]